MLRLLLAAALMASPAPAGAQDKPADAIGTRPPAWEITDWVQGGPLTLDGLRGRVVLVRWWTGPGCPYCSASAPFLNDWDAAYREAGLTIIGLYHHKSEAPLSRGEVDRLAQQLGFRFPIGIDADWRTLERWWLEGRRRGFTSVTFLLDRRGVARLVHPGGTYSKAEAGRIEALLREPPAAEP